MTCNYTCNWLTTSSNNLIVDHNSVKEGLKVIDCIVLRAEYWRHFLETGPDPIAMVIRVELFTLKPSETIQICTAWLLTHDYFTGGVCLAGPVDE